MWIYIHPNPNRLDRLIKTNRRRDNINIVLRITLTSASTRILILVGHNYSLRDPVFIANKLNENHLILKWKISVLGGLVK